MRLAIISDIHGNLVALDVALADIAQRDVDAIVCLGDVAEFGPQPSECLARLRQIGCPVVMGNTDQRLPDPARAALLEQRADDWAHAIELWVIQQIGPIERAQIGSFVPTLTLDLAGQQLLAFHGSPRNNREVLLATTPEDMLTAALAGATAPLLAGGHTHRQLLRLTGMQTLLNPGSVGMPSYGDWHASERHYLAQAEYLLLNATGSAIEITFVRQPYPLEVLAEVVHASGMPHPERWLAQWRAA